LDLLDSFPPGYHKNERLRLRRPGENFGIFTHCLLTKLRREGSDIKNALHEKPAGESSCGGRWIVATKLGLYQSSDAFLFTEIALTVLTNTQERKKKLRGTKICRAVAICMQPFEFGVPTWRRSSSSSLNDTVCWDDPAITVLAMKHTCFAPLLPHRPYRPSAC
jgi:hypothetical protein